MKLKMQDIKCGDLFWECGPSGNYQFEAMADANTDGDIVTLQGRLVATGEPQAFMMRLSAPWYGPSLYSAPAYAVPNDDPMVTFVPGVDDR